MKKKRIIKKWVAYTLVILNAFNIALISGEWASLKMQVLYSLFGVWFMLKSFKLFSDREVLKYEK